MIERYRRQSSANKWICDLTAGLIEIDNDPTQITNSAMKALVISLLCFSYGQGDNYKSINDL